MTTQACIRHPLIEGCAAAHGFGTRDSTAPLGSLRPVQVHGADVLRVGADASADRGAGEADAIVCGWPGQSIAIATADCLPVLACNESGNAVAAIHAGWRGLAKGVIEAGIEALREISPGQEAIYAVIGPHIGECCYEVDEPVLEAMTERFGVAAVLRASRSTRPGHAQLSLAALAHSALERAGIARHCRGQVAKSCTACESQRFHSFRRQGKTAGRMVHFIATTHQ